MIIAVLVVAAVLCAVQAVRVKRLLASALWLAGVSALTALTLYLLGAHEVAVIELSVGTGLVTVLFVFAIGVAGDEVLDMRTLVPKPLAWVLVLASVLLLGVQALPLAGAPAAAAPPAFRDTFWVGRAMDVLAQLVLIFAGVLGVLGLLAAERAPAEAQAPAVTERAAAPAPQAAAALPAETPAEEEAEAEAESSELEEVAA